MARLRQYHWFPARGVVGLAVIALTATSLIALARTTTVIDPAKTRISFDIDAMGWPTTHGVFKAFDGRISVDLDSPEKSAVTFRVNAASIEAGSPGITGYIKSESMLNVARYPEISFRSTSVSRTGERQVRVTGDMNFFGTTLPASFDVDVEKSARGKEMAFVARGTIRRSDYGFISGQPLISDDVRITVATAGLAE